MTDDNATIAQPIPKHIADDLERADWTPIEALRFYADGKHFDIVHGATHIIDTGAIASNALKHADIDYAGMKGDVAAEANEYLAALRGELDHLFWPVNPAKSRRQLINQIGQMNYRLSALREQTEGLEKRNRGLREQIAVLNRAIEKRKAVFNALQAATTAINAARQTLLQIPPSSIDLYEQAGEGIDQLDGALQVIGELEAGLADPRPERSDMLRTIDLDFAEIVSKSKAQPTTATRML